MLKCGERLRIYQRACGVRHPRLIKMIEVNVNSNGIQRYVIDHKSTNYLGSFFSIVDKQGQIEY